MACRGHSSSSVDTTRRVMAGRRHITRRINHKLFPGQEMESLSSDEDWHACYLRPGWYVSTNYIPPPPSLHQELYLHHLLSSLPSLHPYHCHLVNVEEIKAVVSINEGSECVGSIYEWLIRFETLANTLSTYACLCNAINTFIACCLPPSCRRQPQGREASVARSEASTISSEALNHWVLVDARPSYFLSYYIELRFLFCS